MEATYTLFLVALFVAVAAIVVPWHFRRSRRILEEWAHGQGYQIEHANYCWLWRGPYVFRSGESHTVYRVAVRDDQGQRRTGWVRCGGWFFGLFSNEADVRWDE